MNRSRVFWIFSFMITIASGYYQRVTGPTYPLQGTVQLDSVAVVYDLQRNHGGDGGAPVKIDVSEENITGMLEWKRFKTSDSWQLVPMVRHGQFLTAELPHQPPAGKLEYRVRLMREDTAVVVPPRGTVVIRFKGDVPLFVLIPHIIVMFMAMLLSTRTAFECVSIMPDLKHLTYWTLGLLTIGGMILGPIVQKYAFGEYWTGVPFGTDLTDNKTLIAFLAWLGALIALHNTKRPIPWIIAAAVLTLIIFLIPHSLFGSELKYTN